MPTNRSTTRKSTCRTATSGRISITEEKSHVAKTLADYRGNYKYNLLDQNLRALNARVPLFSQWDDHEVADDWCPGESVERDRQLRKLVARGRQAFHEFKPTLALPSDMGRIHRRISYGPSLDVFLLDMRSYRTANDARENALIIGADQLGWLKHELGASQATWKVIAADQPLGLATPDAVGQGDGPLTGREFEIADLLSFIKAARIPNTVWITADVHYTAALISIPAAPSSRISSRSGSLFQVHCTPGPGRRDCPTTPSDRAFITRRPAAKSRATILRLASGCSSSGMWRSTAKAR